MLRIALYGKDVDTKKIKNILKQVFTKNNIQFKIYNTSNSLKYITEYLPDNDFRIFMECADDSTLYMIKIYRTKSDAGLILGTMSFPPTIDEINKELIRNHELSNISAHGEYTVKGINNIGKILHEDIEYIQGEGEESIIYLKSGDRILSCEKLNKVEEELGREYFVRCSSKYVVNVLNIYKIYNENGHLNMVVLASGAKIPISRTYCNRFSELQSKLIRGYANLKIFDV